MNENIPDGDFLVFTILGEEKKVNINAIAPFEITEIEAKQYLETEIKQGLEDVKIPLVEIIQSSLSQKPQIANDEEFIIDLISKLTNASCTSVVKYDQLNSSLYLNYIISRNL
jgi:hypothetical protein